MIDLETQRKWLPLARLSDKPRLFCFHHAGGSAQFFRPWQQALQEQFDLCAIQLPGRWARMREPAYRSAQQAAAATHEALEPLFQPPYLLFGHSLGALIAFELSRRLAEAKIPAPARLIVSGCRNPRSGFDDPGVEKFTDEQLRQHVLSFGMLPQAIIDQKDMLEIFLPILRADLIAAYCYQFTGDHQVNCPLTVLGGDDDPLVPTSSLTGWRDFCSAEHWREPRVFAGDHFYLTQHQQALLDEISAPEI